VLVNRGWIPRSLYNPKQRARPSERTEILGVIRPAESNRDPLATGSRAQDNWFVAMDPHDISEYCGIKQNVVMLIDQVADKPATNAMQKPTLEQPQMIERHDHLLFYVMPQTHIGYMVTWYGLCAWIIGTALYMKKTRRI
jgi:cytochrome oxidase assembly protein ShyY1